MDRIKLFAAIIISLIIIGVLIGVLCLVTRITVKTNGLFLLILAVIALVAEVYVSL